MKKLLVILGSGLVGFSLQAQPSLGFPDYEPFANATSSGGTSYAVGANLIGQTNAQGLGWYAAGSGAGGQPVIAAGALTVPGLSPDLGNSVSWGGASGISARMNLGTTATSSIISPTTPGTVYYSMAFQVNTLGSLSSTPSFVAGFNNSTGSQSTQPTTVGARLYTRLSGTGFNLGINKADGTAGDIVWESATYSLNQTIFLVADYSFSGTPSAASDSVALWVNPNSSTFGSSTAPTADLTTSAGANMGTSGSSDQIASLLLREASTAEPGKMTADQVSVGITWADVTPTPEPGVVALMGLGAAGFLFLRRRRR